MRKLILVFFLFVLTASVYAQEKPRVAVVPFNPVGVSESDASVITSLFETALVQTESFNVIEQNQIADIMEAQAYTMTGCTDESCAIEVGKLLAAEQIILGELSTIGGKFILNAKIIDVQEGRNIKADKVEAAGMGDMTDAAELLAYKLAGLTFTSGGDVRVAQAFGEAMIETAPAGADIYINGVKKGVSPDLITRIPLGTIRVEARKGNLYALREVNVSTETAKISLTLEEQYGNLFIKSSEQVVDVYLDGSRLGALDSGFFDNLAVGDHTLELKGSNVYWSGDITLEAGKSTKVEAYPRGFGTIEYTLPEGAEIEITGSQFRKLLHGSGTLTPIWEGRYTARVLGERYNDYRETIQVETGQAYRFSPALVVSRSYLEGIFLGQLDKYKAQAETSGSITGEMVDEVGRLLSDIRDQSYSFPALEADTEKLHRGMYETFLLARVEALEADSSGGPGTVTESMAASGKTLQGDIRKASYDFGDLEKRTESALIILNKKIELQNLYEEKQAMEDRIAADEAERKKKSTNGFITLGIGAAGGAAAGICAILAGAAYEEYLEQSVTEAAVALRDRFKTLDLVTYIAAGVGALGGGISGYCWLTRPGANTEADDYTALTAKIAALEAELR